MNPSWAKAKKLKFSFSYFSFHFRSSHSLIYVAQISCSDDDVVKILCCFHRNFLLVFYGSVGFFKFFLYITHRSLSNVERTVVDSSKFLKIIENPKPPNFLISMVLDSQFCENFIVFLKAFVIWKKTESSLLFDFLLCGGFF